MLDIIQKVNNFLDEYKLSDKNKLLLVAFSGGFDSMCLLDILSKLELNVAAIHLNHNWRGQDSINDENNCRKFCDERNIEFYCENIDKNIPHTETAARDARYKFFEKCAEKFKSSVILTAHNANDNAETVIYRIIKGTAVDGLSGIAKHREIYYRPLINVSREEIEQYCKINKLSPNIDHSNSDIKYNRNYIRHEVLPKLKSINPDAVKAINSLSEIAQEESAILDEIAADIGNSAEKFTQAKDPIKKHYIKKFINDYDLEYDRSRIELIKDFITSAAYSKSGKTLSLSKTLQLFVNTSTIEIIPTYTDKYTDEIIINKEGEYHCHGKTFSIKPCTSAPDTFPDDSTNTAYVEINGIDFVLRTRKDGDIIAPIGLNGHHQKLKKFLNEKKIPKHEKDNLLLLCAGNEVLWIPGLALSDKIKVVNRATHILKLEER